MGERSVAKEETEVERSKLVQHRYPPSGRDEDSNRHDSPLSPSLVYETSPWPCVSQLCVMASALLYLHKEQYCSIILSLL